ncbi:MAG: hypothetical protein V3V10_06800 [Planctomycetota bacterium]
MMGVKKGEQVLPLVLGALPGTAEQIAKKIKLDPRRVQKCLSNASRSGRNHVKITGRDGRAAVWGLGKAKKHVIDGTTGKVVKAKRKYVKRKKRRKNKKRPAALLLQLDIINTRLDAIEEVLGIES